MNTSIKDMNTIKVKILSENVASVLTKYEIKVN